MNPKVLESESSSTSSSGAGKHEKAASEDSDSVDQQARAYSLVPFASTEANMTNCQAYCKSFFRRYKTIHFNQLIAMWMMGGYLRPVGSVEEAYDKGLEILYDLVYEEGVLQVSDGDDGMVKCSESALQKPNRCKHQGYCVKGALLSVNSFLLEKIDNILLADGMQKQRKVAVSRNYSGSGVLPSNLGVGYISHFNPILNSLEPLLETVNNLTGLLLRGRKAGMRIWRRMGSTDKVCTTSLLKLSKVVSFLRKLGKVDNEKENKMVLKFLDVSNKVPDFRCQHYKGQHLQQRWGMERGQSW